MAIAEVEPKKSEVAAVSAGVSDGIKDKVLNTGKNFADKGFASTSTSVGTAKKYNLYDNIKGFRFEMPDGWNDEDIGLFVTCCWEKKDDFGKSNVDRTKIWADIAQSGANQSRNPSLFTINSCLALAERIRYYVSKNTSVFLDNEAYMKFHSDVKGLLPHFSDNFDSKKVSDSKCIRRKVKNKTMNEQTSELLKNDSDLGDVIHDLALENAEAIRSGNRNVWTEMSNKLSEHLGLNTDAKTILELEKNKIISYVTRMEEKGMDKKKAFIERARGFIEVFDFINPKKIKVSDYLPVSDSTVDSVTQDKDKSIQKPRRLSNNNLPENSSINKNLDSYSGEDHQDEEMSQGKRVKRSRAALRGKRTRSKAAENKFDSDIDNNQEITIEPSSTTSFDDPSHRSQSSNGKDKKQNDFASNIYSNEVSEKTLENLENTIKNSGKQKKGETSPRRIMPPRLARNKVISYSLLSNRRPSSTKEISSGSRNIGMSEHTSKRSRQQPSYLVSARKENCSQVAKNSPNFTGFDTDSEDTTIDFTDRFRRIKGAKNTSSAMTNVTNPDTTTNDLDDKIIPNSAVSDVPFMKRLNRKRKDNMNKKHDIPSKQEDVRTKVRVVHADCTMKNLVVKLVDCHGSMDNPTHRNIIKSKDSPFSSRIQPDRRKEVGLIEESVVLAKDVVDSEYNPSSDSAKLVSDEHLNNGHLSGLGNETKSVNGAVPLSATSLKDSNQIPKHHITPFCELSKHSMIEGPRVSADSSEDIRLANSIGTLKMASFCSKLQDNSVSSRYSTGMSSSLDVNQKPSTSSGNVNSTTSDKVALESALATLKKCRKELVTNQDNSSVCVTSSNVFENNQFITQIEDAQLPEWFGTFVTDFRKHEAWKIQQLFKMQQELADVEHRKVLLLEKILGSLVNE